MDEDKRKLKLIDQMNLLLKEDTKEDNIPWWIYAAHDAIKIGNYRLISERLERDKLYMARFWLTPPKLSNAGSSLEDYESANSVMLHRFALGDDDNALHDHPWSFTTTILAGSYDEYVPSEQWLSFKNTEKESINLLGPHPVACLVHRNCGDTISHSADSLHSVGFVKPGTWTLVRTGDRIREWGFHPYNKEWINWRTFLGLEIKNEG